MSEQTVTANTFTAFGAAYAASAIAMEADDREFAKALNGLNFEAWNAARGEFIKGATDAGYKAGEKLWERTVKRLNELFGVEKPKAESKKAQEAATKRDAAKQAAAAIIKAKLGAKADFATPAQILELAKDDKLISANKKALMAEAMRRDSEASKEKAAKVKEEAAALYDAIHAMIKPHRYDPKMLGKIKAALAKIK